VSEHHHVALPDGRVVVDFASNDYLGLRRHRVLVEAAARGAADWGTGAGASRLITGSSPLHEEVETALAQLHGAQRALVTSSGYAANVATLSTLAALEGATFFSDELNHASIIDALRMAKRVAPVYVYPHLDYDELQRLLTQHCTPSPSPSPSASLPIVVSDTVFSMDGDRADLTALAALATRHDGVLVVDDAHEVFTPTKAGPDAGVVVVGTLSKRLASQGGYVAGDSAVIDLIVNRARPFIFSTALAPPLAATVLAALELEAGAEGDRFRAALRANLDTLGCPPAAATADVRSPIVALVVGSEQAALDASERLLDAGFLVPAIRPPTVAPGSSRLRIAVSASHRPDDVARLRDALATTGLRTAHDAAARASRRTLTRPAAP
jgi:8-amino-7-oxononanoate synthase